jgi:hypothetical protein
MDLTTFKLRYSLQTYCMKFNTLFLLSFTFFACNQQKAGTDLVTKTDTLVGENLTVVATYPQFAFQSKDSAAILHCNEVLKNRTDVQYDLVNANNQGAIEIRSNFKIALENDTLLSLEFFKRNNAATSSPRNLTYHPLMVNLRSYSFYLFPEAIWLNFDRGQLLPYLKKYEEKNPNAAINYASYETGSMDVISFLIAEDSLILYPGGEGEFFGKMRVAVPFSALNLN